MDEIRLLTLLSFLFNTNDLVYGPWYNKFMSAMNEEFYNVMGNFNLNFFLTMNDFRFTIILVIL